MKAKNPLQMLSKKEWLALFLSLTVILVAFLLTSRDYLTLITSLFGAIALAFVAKGLVVGEVVTVIFAVFYGIVSFFLRYYGEMITYLCMTTPICIFSIVSWLRHPFKDSGEVEVHKMSRRECALMWGLAALVTTAFFFILQALGNASLIVSTVSITTSFVASFLAMMRSPFYAVAYALNDVVLITLWVIAAWESISYLPMVVCFLVFLCYDIYGFLYWRHMQRRQRAA